MGKRRKKIDPFYKALLWVLIACGAFLVYENLTKLGRPKQSVKITKEPSKSETKIVKPNTSSPKQASDTKNLKANQDWDQTTLKVSQP